MVFVPQESSSFAKAIRQFARYSMGPIPITARKPGRER